MAASFGFEVSRPATSIAATALRSSHRGWPGTKLKRSIEEVVAGSSDVEDNKSRQFSISWCFLSSPVPVRRLPPSLGLLLRSSLMLRLPSSPVRPASSLPVQRVSSSLVQRLPSSTGAACSIFAHAGVFRHGWRRFFGLSGCRFFGLRFGSLFQRFETIEPLCALLNSATMCDFLFGGRGSNNGAYYRKHEPCDNSYAGSPDVRPKIGHSILQTAC